MRKLSFLILLGFGAIAKAQIPQPDPDTTAKHFLIVASIGNLQEANAGQLALQKAKSADVRSFAQMMVKEHGDAEQQLLALAKRQGLALPPSGTGGIKPDPLLANAPNFDSAYVHAMVAGHGNTVQTFENYATTGKNPAVRAWAQQMLPTLKAHLEHIKMIDQQFTSKQKTQP